MRPSVECGAALSPARLDGSGKRFVLVDPAAGTRELASTTPGCSRAAKPGNPRALHGDHANLSLASGGWVLAAIL